MAIVAHLRNLHAHMKDILALQLIHWLDIASLRDLVVKENHPIAKEKGWKDARKKIAVKSKSINKCRYIRIIHYKVSIKGRVYGPFRIFNNEEFGVDKFKYL